MPPSIKVRMTRHEADQMAQFLQWACTHQLTEAEATDTSAGNRLLRFKYWMGRNLDHILKVREETSELLDGAGQPVRRGGMTDAQWQAECDAWNFGIGARVRLCALRVGQKAEELAERNDKGEIIRFGDSGLPKLAPEAQLVFEQFRDQLMKGEFSDVAEWDAATAARKSALLDEPVDVELFPWPFDQLSPSLSGAIVAGIRAVLTGLPE